MPEFIIGARGHDFGRHTPEELLTSIGKAGFRCTQLAYTKAIEGVKSYADITPELVEATKAAVAASGVSIAVDGTYVELSYADEDKRRAEVAKVLSQIPVAKALGAGCMGSETTNMAKQPGVTRKEAQEALLRSLGEILPLCEEQGVLFAVECVYYHAMNTPEAVKMVLDTMASPNLRVICDFANYVGPENASVDAQRRIWDKVGSWYGDKIGPELPARRHPLLHLAGRFLRGLCGRLCHAQGDAASGPSRSAGGSRPRPRGQRYCVHPPLLHLIF